MANVKTSAARSTGRRQQTKAGSSPAQRHAHPVGEPPKRVADCFATPTDSLADEQRRAAGAERHEIDEQLIADIVAGDRSAYAALYDRHAPRLFAVLIRSLRHRADAEDVLQEIFQQVWRSARQYVPDRSSPEVWLMLLTRSRLLDFVRRKRPDATGSLTHTEAPYEDPLTVLTKVEAAQSVHRALGRLPAEQRAAITLSYFTGLTHQQIAEQQSIPLGTAKTRILLGMRALRKSLHAHLDRRP